VQLACSRSQPAYTDAIALKVKQEFAAKEKAKTEKKPEPKPATKALKKTA
jgi:ParB family chromosome partitioning protein